MRASDRKLGGLSADENTDRHGRQIAQGVSRIKYRLLFLISLSSKNFERKIILKVKIDRSMKAVETQWYNVMY